MKAPFYMLLLVLNFCLLGNTEAQKRNIVSRYFDKLVNDTSDVSQPQFLVYPTLAYSPETSWEIGLSSLYVYYAKNDTSNRLSEINGFTFFTLENQYGIWFDHALYSDQSKWFSLGRIRFQSFPLHYHGIGPDTPADYVALVDANQLQVKERVLRRARPNLYMGIELDFQRLSSVRFNSTSDEPVAEPLGSKGSSNLGFGLGIIYDNRHNILNVREGLFSELAFLRYNRLWSSDYTFTAINSDTRIYKSISKNNVLAAQLLGQFNFGNVPFNQLALLGGESIMRGYYLGRFRDKNQLAAQVEYRFLPLPLSFSKRIGAAVFASTGTVFPDLAHLNAQHLKLAGGGGLRYLLFPKKDIFTRLDVAFTKEGTGFYIFIGESF
ncbi:BamA/TamA family outer membrane protein [Pontibacter qinzhouensis]|uniref:BamA/TamA family outer membrane protein n=1 Tax=Pontibacter qinzhouensis TaxID=2603253 RepID=A0A5C8KC49_9BACT|nr:BamA/TamA family outer membrane protein [Pontibacter qinzhouensis]TXK47935.1 BamA/TamA family outer membrane protein [Pontibacter qinzhouensis]